MYNSCAKKSFHGRGAERALAPPFRGRSKRFLVSDGTTVAVESTEEAEDDESLGEVGGRSSTSSSNSTLSSKMGVGCGGRCDSLAFAKDFCKSLIVRSIGKETGLCLCYVVYHEINWVPRASACVGQGFDMAFFKSGSLASGRSATGVLGGWWASREVNDELILDPRAKSCRDQSAARVVIACSLLMCRV